MGVFNKDVKDHDCSLSAYTYTVFVDICEDQLFFQNQFLQKRLENCREILGNCAITFTCDCISALLPDCSVSVTSPDRAVTVSLSFGAYF